MATGDMPALSKSAYTSTAYGLNADNVWDTPINANFMAAAPGGTSALGALARNASERRLLISEGLAAAVMPKPIAPKKEKSMAQVRRLVQVFIADPDENVPLENSLLYSGEQKLTDATDQELFFEIDMKSILDKHNELRKTLINKKVKERTEYLEPTKIRDLKMVVVDVASF